MQYNKEHANDTMSYVARTAITKDCVEQVKIINNEISDEEMIARY